MDRRENAALADVEPLVDAAVIRAMATSVEHGAPGILHDLARQTARVRRNDRPLSILLFQLRESAAQTMEKSEVRRAQRRLMARVSEGLRHTDLCGALGLMEILSVLPNAPIDGARIAAARLGEGKGARQMRGTSLSVCVGVAELRNDDDAVKTLLDRARDDIGRSR